MQGGEEQHVLQHEVLAHETLHQQMRRFLIQWLVWCHPHLLSASIEPPRRYVQPGSVARLREPVGHPFGMEERDVCRRNALGIVQGDDQGSAKQLRRYLVDALALAENVDRIGGVYRRDISEQDREIVH